MTKQEALEALRATAFAVLDTVKESPEGAPAGPMFLAFQAHGLSLETFEAITGALVSAGKIKRLGDVFYPV